MMHKVTLAATTSCSRVGSQTPLVATPTTIKTLRGQCGRIPSAQARVNGKRFIAISAHESSLHLVSSEGTDRPSSLPSIRAAVFVALASTCWFPKYGRSVVHCEIHSFILFDQRRWCHADYDDGTILFCFGDKADSQEPTAADLVSDTQQQDEAPIAEQAVTTSQQNAEELTQDPDKAQDLNTPEESQEDQLSSSDDTQQTVSPQAEQATTPDSGIEHSGLSVSSADISGEEASSSDSTGEQLWDMTPQQLEGLKVGPCSD